MLSFCGIDVSKDRLDVMVLPDEYSSSVPNDPAGWAILVEQLRGFSITAIGIEASGGYERGAVRSLQAAGARAPSQSFQAAAVRQGERGSGQERSARRPNDRLVRRHHADASSAADDAGSGAARRDARCSPPAQR